MIGGLRYGRIVLKISGESLGGDRAAVDYASMRRVARAVVEVRLAGTSVVVVVGGGNIFRGSCARDWNIASDDADEVGLLATGVNALLLAAVLRETRVPVSLFGNGPCGGAGEPWTPNAARAALARGDVVVVAGGMGQRGVSADVPAVEAAVDSAADAVIMAKYLVNGVYDSDPRTNRNASLLPRVAASEALRLRLRVVDAAALELCRRAARPIHIIDAATPALVADVVRGLDVGSVILPW
jgi:uridylate kinase